VWLNGLLHPTRALVQKAMPRFPAMTSRSRDGRIRNAVPDSRANHGSRYCSTSPLRGQGSCIRDERTSSCRLSFTPLLQFSVRCRGEQREARAHSPGAQEPERPLFLNHFRNLLQGRNGAKISLPRVKTSPIFFTLAAVFLRFPDIPIRRGSSIVAINPENAVTKVTRPHPRSSNNWTIQRGFVPPRKHKTGGRMTR